MPPLPDLANGAPAPDALPVAEPAPAAPKVNAEDAAGGEHIVKPEIPPGDDKPKTDDKPAESQEATLARKQLVAAEKKVRQAKAVLAQSESLRSRAALADDVEKMLKEDPDALFQRFGLTAEDVLTASVTKAAGKPATKTEAERLAALEQERADDLKARDKDRETAKTAAETQLRKDVGEGVKTLVSADESFDLVNTLGRHNDVAEAVWNYGKKYPEMTREQAEKAVRYFARKLETQLEEEHLAPLTKSKKFGAKYAAREPAAGGDAPAGEPKNLHNGIARSGPPTEGDPLPEDDAGRWREIKRRAGIR